MHAGLRRHTPALVLATVAGIAAVVCAIAVTSVNAVVPVLPWAREAGQSIVMTKSQYESMLVAQQVGELAAVVVVLAAVSAMVVALVMSRRSAAA